VAEWTTRRLGEIGRIITGKTPPTADPENYGGVTPFVTPTDMDGRRTISTTLRCVSDKGISTVQSSYVREPAIVVSCIGSDMGKSALVFNKYVSNQQINSIIPSVECDLFYVYYNLLGRRDEIRGLAGGAAQPILNKSDFSRLTIRLPPLNQQRKIGRLLQTLDDKIELNQRINETLEKMAQAIFLDWFVDFGPVRRKQAGATDPVEVIGALILDPIQAAETALLLPEGLDDKGLPIGWRAESVISQAHWVNGAAYKKMHFVSPSDGLPVIKIAELKAGVTATTGFTNTDLGSRYRIGDGELLFSWSGNPDTSIDTFIWTGGPAWLNQHIFAVRPNGTRSLGFLFAMLKFLNPTFAEIARDKQTTGLGHVTKEDLKRLEVVVPTRGVEAAFDAVMMPIFLKLQSTLLESRTLAETRDYLLPRLMSGEVRAIAGEVVPA